MQVAEKSRDWPDLADFNVKQRFQKVKTLRKFSIMLLEIYF